MTVHDIGKSQLKRLRLACDVPKELGAAIDSARGELTRADWIRNAVYRALARAGQTDNVPWEHQRGRYDRLVAGAHVTERWRRTERRRRRRREYDRQWKRGEVGRVAAQREAQRRKARIEIAWTWGDDGIVQASDLEAQGTEAGYVDAGGRYWSSSRHQAPAVRAALIKVMQGDPGRIWPERWRLFAAGPDPHD